MPTISLPNALRQHAPMLALPTRFQWIGGLSRRFNMMIWGPPESRKSSLALQLADALRRFGTVCYVMKEEDPYGAALKDRAWRNRVNSERIQVMSVKKFPELEQELTTNRYDFVIIDSVSHFQPYAYSEQFIELSEKLFETTSFIFVYQVTADKKNPRDGIKMWHHVDMVIRCEKPGTATVERNRPTGMIGGVYEIR